MKKILVLIAALCIICLTGCDNTPQVPNEMTIREDIEESATFQEYKEKADLKITNLEIVKRQTTPEDKIDKVWVAVDASSDSVESKMYYCVTYGLYNEGWIFEEENFDSPDEWVFKPLCGINKEDALWYLPYGAEITSEYLNLEDNYQTFSYHYVDSHKYCDIEHTGELEFRFGSGYYGDGGGEWHSYGTYDSTYENWHLNGVWDRRGKDTVILYDVDEVIADNYTSLHILNNSDEEFDIDADYSHEIYYEWGNPRISRYSGNYGYQLKIAIPFTHDWMSFYCLMFISYDTVVDEVESPYEKICDFGILPN